MLNFRLDDTLYSTQTLDRAWPQNERAVRCVVYGGR